MKASQFYFKTYKEDPTEAVVPSHKLLLRSGAIVRLASGLYTWSPLGYRMLSKVERVVREEMNAAGALELEMPVIQPADLWQESGRWGDYGAELLRFKDRHGRDCCAGPTHEEVITDFVRKTLSSYKQLPFNLYQIQTKIRDEIRPRFGILRAREFIMKDAYSFHMEKTSLKKTYQCMYAAYATILKRLGLDYRAVEADGGSIGGAYSHEFHVLAEHGEDALVYTEEENFAANIEVAPCQPPNAKRLEPQQALELFDTPNQKTIKALVEQHNIPIEKTVKTLIVEGREQGQLVALMVRGDHTLNEVKATKLNQVASPLKFAEEGEVRQAVGAGFGSLGPVGLPMDIIVDSEVAVLNDFSAGANEDGKHYRGINWGRDAHFGFCTDIRNIEEGDLSPQGFPVKLCRGIEVGHVFQLGDKYSKEMGLEVLDEGGAAVTLQMGCYGIGISRLVAAAIEQHHDDKGLALPMVLAPFQVALVALGSEKDSRVQKVAQDLYTSLLDQGVEVFWDDRLERAGVKFSDIDLIGFPLRVVVSSRGLDSDQIEVKHRQSAHVEQVPLSNILTYLKSCLDQQ